MHTQQEIQLQPPPPVALSCTCAVPRPRERAVHKGAARTFCERCGLPLPLRLRRT
jgi:hypothetical protein